VAALLGGEPAEVVFTAGGTESINLAIRGVAEALEPTGRRHLIATGIEHEAVLNTLKALARRGWTTSLLPVDRTGIVSVDALTDALTDNTAVVSVMHANNETGALQHIGKLAAVAHANGALVHCDAAQAAGKIPLDADGLDVDLLTVVGHKMYAPKGVAALYVGAGLDLEPVVYGGGQEGGRRAGTESVTLIAALGTAARLAADDLANGAGERLLALRDRLQQGLERRLPGDIRLNGPVAERLPNTLNVTITGMVAHELLAAVPTIAASTGSACHSGQHTPSPVLTAMGADRERALGAVRLSLGRWTTTEDVDFAVDEIARAAR
jgi:cysteine desulfurase